MEYQNCNTFKFGVAVLQMASLVDSRLEQEGILEDLRAQRNILDEEEAYALTPIPFNIWHC